MIVGGKCKTSELQWPDRLCPLLKAPCLLNVEWVRDQTAPRTELPPGHDNSWNQTLRGELGASSPVHLFGTSLPHHLHGVQGLSPGSQVLTQPSFLGGRVECSSRGCWVWSVTTALWQVLNGALGFSPSSSGWTGFASMQVLVEDSERDSGERERGDRKKEEEEEKVGRERRGEGEENRYYERETAKCFWGPGPRPPPGSVECLYFGSMRYSLFL